MTLYNAFINKPLIIVSTPDDDMLQAIGVHPGKLITVLNKQPFGGPVVIQMLKRDFAIDKQIALQIEVAVSI